MSTDSTSVLEQLQECCRGTLAAVPAIEEASVISRLKGNIQSQLAEALNSLGMSIVVLPPVPVSANGALASLIFDKVRVQIHCVTIPLTNKTGLTALEAAELVLQSLHQIQFHVSGASCLLVPDSTPIDPVDDAKKGDFVICNLITNGSLGPDHIARTPRPVIAYDTETEEVTITCADGDALIYYTDDGSFPYPDNDTATLYNQPVTHNGVIVTHEDSVVRRGVAFDADSSTEIRAIAIHPDQLPSNLKSITLSTPSA